MQIQKPKVLNRRNILLFGLGMVLIFAFLPVLNYNNNSFASSPPIVISTAHNECNGTPNCYIGLSVITGDNIIVGVSEAGQPNACSSSCGITPNTFSDSLGNVFHEYGYQEDGSGSLFSVYYTSVVTTGGTDNLSLTLNVNSGSTGLELIQLNALDVAGTVLYSTATAAGTTGCCNLGSSMPYGQYDLLLQTAADDCELTCGGSTGFTYTSIGSGLNQIHTFIAGSFEIMGTAYLQRVTSSGTNFFVMSNNAGGTDRHWTESILDVSAGGSNCPSCVITTGTTTFLTTSCTTISNTTYCATVTETSTFTSTLGSTYITTLTSNTTVTQTNTVLNAPNTDSFAFWGIPLMFNFILAFSFLAPAMALKANNSFLYALLFFTGLLFGGIIGLMAHITPWYDPVVCGLVLAAVIVFRAL